jgi:hypothetical protein
MRGDKIVAKSFTTGYLMRPTMNSKSGSKARLWKFFKSAEEKEISDFFAFCETILRTSQKWTTMQTFHRINDRF